jgi:hypothetical protein
MIVYIENPIKWNITDDMKEVLNDLGFSYTDTHILDQKWTGDETEVNMLFAEIFFNDVKIEYGNYGGDGCDFSINISEK